MISNTVFNQHENVLAEARFELTLSGFRSAALPIELFSPTGIGESIKNTLQKSESIKNTLQSEIFNRNRML